MAKVMYVEIASIQSTNPKSMWNFPVERVDVQIETASGELFTIRGESGQETDQIASAIRALITNLINDHELLKAL